MPLSATLAELVAEYQSKGILLEIFGDRNVQVTGITAVESCGPGDLVFMDKKDFLVVVESRRPAVVVTTPALKSLLEQIPGITIVLAPNVAMAHALIKSKFAARNFDEAGWGRIHPSAIIHESAQVDPTASVEPKVVIGRGVRIGKNSRIMAGAIIEHDAVIGENTVVFPNAVIGYRCQIGNDVRIHSGTVVGGEGYGFAQDQKRKSYPIPQTGIVVIEDRVRIGANCCIDRAAYTETRIRAGTKLDNLCHVAHGVEIGEDCLLTAQFCVAGSTKIGKRVMASGQTGVLDHMNVCDDVVLVHRAGVSKDIDKPGIYAGLPLQPLNEYMKNSVVLKAATELRKRLMDLEKFVGKKTDENGKI